MCQAEQLTSLVTGGRNRKASAHLTFYPHLCQGPGHRIRTSPTHAGSSSLENSSGDTLRVSATVRFTSFLCDSDPDR